MADPGTADSHLGGQGIVLAEITLRESEVLPVEQTPPDKLVPQSRKDPLGHYIATEAGTSREAASEEGVGSPVAPEHVADDDVSILFLSL